MKQRFNNTWNRLSRIGLKDNENILEYREVILLNKLLLIMPAVMAVYIPVEIYVNGLMMIPAVLIMIGLFMATLLFHKYRKFKAGHYYLFLVSSLFILSMGLVVGKGINNHVMLIPISLLGFIMFKTNKERISIFFITCILYLLQLNLFEIVPPSVSIASEIKAIFSSIFFILGLLLTFLIGFYFLKINREYESIIIHQKELMEIKNKEITDSITYAKRIQSAILPSASLLNEVLPNSFVLYLPKDVVAGDFYWVEKKAGNILFAVADCTGHGVPGAMISVVCHNALNRAVREFNLIDPAKILDKARDIIIEEFEKSEEDIKDGMDISLCSLNIKTRELLWAGANNPLWIVRKEKIIEIKADKQPIGKYSEKKPFHQHSIFLKEEDLLYIFTDGYQDQFGGDKGKKFKAAKMKELLLSLHELSLKDQKDQISKTFSDWKGKLEQIDDVCIMGIKII